MPCSHILHVCEKKRPIVNKKEFILKMHDRWAAARYVENLSKVSLKPVPIQDIQADNVTLAPKEYAKEGRPRSTARVERRVTGVSVTE